MKMKRALVARRLGVGFASVALILFATAFVAVLATRAIYEKAKLATDHAEAVFALERVRFISEQKVATSRAYFLTEDPRFLEELEREREEFAKQVAIARAKIGADENGQLSDVEEAEQLHHELLVRAIGLQRSGTDRDTILAFWDEKIQPARERLDASLDAVVTRETKVLAELSQLEELYASRAAAFVVVTGGAGLLLSFWLSWAVTRRVSALYRSEQDAVRQKSQALAIAERAVVAREELLAVVSHDLRSPLSAILMKAALIRRTAEAEGTLNKHALSIESVAVRMEYLIKSLLDSASIEAGRLAVERERCDVGELLEATFEVFDGLAAQKSIRLEWQRAGFGNASVLGDHERILQVLSNLVGNAIKFTPEDGTIVLGAVLAGHETRFAVTDTGPGIAEEHLPKLFERYWKAEQGGRRGAGLGLYIAKGIIDAHHGKIWVESSPGKGSTFFFTLPLAEPAQESASLPEEAPSPPGAFPKGGAAHR